MRFKELTLLCLAGFIFSVDFVRTHKLENFHEPESSEINAEVKESLIRRQPKFLFRSTGTTTFTTTLSTNTACFTTSAITAVCVKRRRKRNFNFIDETPFGWHNPNEENVGGDEDAGNVLEINPTQASKSEKDLQPVSASPSARHHKAMNLVQQIESSSYPDEYREPRFVFYFVSTTFSTVTSTATSFTTTTTFSLVNCIPTSFAYSLCG